MLAAYNKYANARGAQSVSGEVFGSQMRHLAASVEMRKLAVGLNFPAGHFLKLQAKEML